LLTTRRIVELINIHEGIVELLIIERIVDHRKNCRIY
jgi:hypothetical protein